MVKDEKRPFEPGQFARLRHRPLNSGLIVGNAYRVVACSKIGGFWMLLLQSPHDKPMDVVRHPRGLQWYSAQRFV